MGICTVVRLYGASVTLVVRSWRFRYIEIALDMHSDGKLTGLSGAVHDAERGVKRVAFQHLVRHHRAHFRRAVDFEIGVSKPKRSVGVTAMARIRQPVRLSGAAKLTVALPFSSVGKSAFQ